jgi:hypothetical protein
MIDQTFYRERNTLLFEKKMTTKDQKSPQSGRISSNPAQG